MILLDDAKHSGLRRGEPRRFKVEPAEGVHAHAAHTALARQLAGRQQKMLEELMQWGVTSPTSDR
ncbi:hypothetical protein A3N45_03465 [Klebsiella aerogenes]|nr:hypothetical protein A3N45_03465 [Klebsiella aerogenes]